MTIQEYIAEIQKQFNTGFAREHAYRPALQRLLQNLLPKFTVVNEPARIACGAPDYIITTKDNLPLAFIEAKDVDDIDLDGRKVHKEQFDRYKRSLDKVIFTDYLDFHLYEEGEYVSSVRIGELKDGKIKPIKENEELFFALVAHLVEGNSARITSPTKLAELMASKARLLAQTISNFFDGRNLDDAANMRFQLVQQYNAFRNVLIHDLAPKEFADLYAQTICYGMFAARLHDTTPEDFSREEAARLIPKTNPFLRKIFQSIAGYDLDNRIDWLVDDLASMFARTDIEKIMKSYGDKDPMIHFYEDFLCAYDGKLRKARGVWYTPKSVVTFIVRAVDEILQKDFELPMGLADYSKIKREIVVDSPIGKNGKKPTAEHEFHKVQVLDPATGTGTFLAEVVSQIYAKFPDQQGMWQSYVEDHLLGRIHGFELLMASYAVAHLKLDMVLNATGYIHKTDKRIGVYLTNSLENFHKDTGTLWSSWLSEEASNANFIKRDNPVMVMLGNPPYSVSSTNTGDWIMHLIGDYKKNLNERKLNLDDDYIKFIRLGQHYIEKNGEGILAYISNNSFLDGITHRQMRLSLLKSFDKIYIVNLHGNSKKKEVCPDGSKDENVFDIQVGTSINIFIKKTEPCSKESLAEVLYTELYGRRECKYDFLNSHSVCHVDWTRLSPCEPYFFFVPKDFSCQEGYDEGFKLDDLFIECNSGVQTKRDDVNIFFEENLQKSVLEDFRTLSESALREKYSLKDNSGWQLNPAISDLKKNSIISKKILYRPFDVRLTNYTGSQGIMGRPRYSMMKHLLGVNGNLALLSFRQSRDGSMCVFVGQGVISQDVLSTLDNVRIFPLYLANDENDVFDGKPRVNFNNEVVVEIEKALGKSVEPLELFDYIYAVLHSNNYRTKYREFLKIDFPRIPYPTNVDEYKRLVALGAKLRHTHLLDKDMPKDIPNLPKVSFPIEGSDVVAKIEYNSGKVYINSDQYFDGISKNDFEFFVGSYQPAQKYLKDRKERKLSFEEIAHYQKMICSLATTRYLMEQIDK